MIKISCDNGCGLVETLKAFDDIGEGVCWTTYKNKILCPECLKKEFKK